MQVALKAAVLEANIEVEAFKRSVTGAEQGEAYFMQNVGNGEVLASMGALLSNREDTSVKPLFRPRKRP